jgi:hypothetical protein
MCLFMSNESQEVPCLSDYPTKSLYTFLMTLKPDTFPPQMPTDLEYKRAAITNTDLLRIIPKSPLYVIDIYVTTRACVFPRMMNILPSNYW